ncbi:acetate--CoA ligase family protein [Streptomyces sp. NPDC008343]|uniref:acetate--CoA ligase family protein n=1 Tax=Streptomyces sp. NPDC008343 TaxID=3364828 RepID=UPI0036EB4B1A
MTDPPTAGPPRSSLAVFRDPGSVAVVGASANPAKWGYWLARGALAGRDRRSVHLVTRGADEILGMPTAPSLAALPEVPDLVAVCVPAPQVGTVVDEALRLGVRGFLGITAGVPDAPALATRITAAGARMIGPSSLGLFDAETALHIAWGDFRPGRLAIVSQSGQVGSELAQLAQRAGLGISRFVSVGGQLDVTMADLLDDLADHASTTAVALYAEGFDDGERIFAAVRRLRRAGKPVLVLSAGDSEAGARAARSHTSALTSPAELVDAACRAAGALRVPTPAALVDVAACLMAGVAPRGRRVAILSDSGGQGALAADCVTHGNLAVPRFSAGLSAEIAGLLPDGAATDNPVDLAGAGEQDLSSYTAVARALLRSGEVDSVLMSGYFGRYGLDSAALAATEQHTATELAALPGRYGRALVVHSMGADGDTAALLREAGVAVFPTVGAASGALSGAVELDARQVRDTPPNAPDSFAPRGFWETRAALLGAGIIFPAARPVHDRAQLLSALAELRGPFVLKASWLEHKTEAGGVRVGLADAAAVTAAFDAMHRRLGEGTYLLEEQDVRSDVTELIVGARRDSGLGPMVTIGAGGTQAEIHCDTVTECAPVSPDQARDMIGRLRCAPLLTGWRGAAPVDLDSLVHAVVAVSRLVARYRGDRIELEINPLRVGPDGAVAVDALLLTSATGPVHETQGET